MNKNEIELIREEFGAELREISEMSIKDLLDIRRGKSVSSKTSEERYKSLKPNRIKGGRTEKNSKLGASAKILKSTPGVTTSAALKTIDFIGKNVDRAMGAGKDVKSIDDLANDMENLGVYGSIKSVALWAGGAASTAAKWVARHIANKPIKEQIKVLEEIQKEQIKFYRTVVNYNEEVFRFNNNIEDYIEHVRLLPSEYAGERGERSAKLDDNVYKLFKMYVKNFNQFFIEGMLRDKVKKEGVENFNYPAYSKSLEDYLLFYNFIIKYIYIRAFGGFDTPNVFLSKYVQPNVATHIKHIKKTTDQYHSEQTKNDIEDLIQKAENDYKQTRKDLSDDPSIKNLEALVNHKDRLSDDEYSKLFTDDIGKRFIIIYYQALMGLFSVGIDFAHFLDTIFGRLENIDDNWGKEIIVNLVLLFKQREGNQVTVNDVIRALRRDVGGREQEYDNELDKTDKENLEKIIERANKEIGKVDKLTKLFDKEETIKTIQKDKKSIFSGTDNNNRAINRDSFIEHNKISDYLKFFAYSIVSQQARLIRDQDPSFVERDGQWLHKFIDDNLERQGAAEKAFLGKSTELKDTIDSKINAVFQGPLDGVQGVQDLNENYSSFQNKLRSFLVEENEDEPSPFLKLNKEFENSTEKFHSKFLTPNTEENPTSKDSYDRNKTNIMNRANAEGRSDIHNYYTQLDNRMNNMGGDDTKKRFFNLSDSPDRRKEIKNRGQDEENMRHHIDRNPKDLFKGKISDNIKKISEEHTIRIKEITQLRNMKDHMEKDFEAYNKKYPIFTNIGLHDEIERLKNKLRRPEEKKPESPSSGGDSNNNKSKEKPDKQEEFQKLHNKYVLLANEYRRLRTPQIANQLNQTVRELQYFAAGEEYDDSSAIDSQRNEEFEDKRLNMVTLTELIENLDNNENINKNNIRNLQEGLPAITWRKNPVTRINKLVMTCKKDEYKKSVGRKFSYGGKSTSEVRCMPKSSKPADKAAKDRKSSIKRWRKIKANPAKMRKMKIRRNMTKKLSKKVR